MNQPAPQKSKAARSRQYDRAIGAVLASAAGDALGSQYEFGPARADDQPVEFGVGYFGPPAASGPTTPRWPCPSCRRSPAANR